MRMNKKLVSVLMAATIASSAIVGCGSVDNSATVLTIGGEAVPAGVANFYARYQQAMYETYYVSFMGEDMWISDMGDDTTYADSVKDGIMSTIQELYVIKQHAEELEIELTEEELEAIEVAADEFMASNKDEEVNEAIGATKANVVEVLSLFKLQAKADPVITAGIDTEVTEEESAQKKMTLVSYEFTHTDEEGNTIEATEEEKVIILEMADELLAKAKESGDLLADATEADASVKEVTFDSTSTTVDAAIIAVADELGKGEFTTVVEGTSGYYVAQVTSLLDAEATEAKVASILSERESALYTETIDTWLEEAEAKVEDSVWSKIDFPKYGVVMYQEEVEEEFEEEIIELTDEIQFTDETEEVESEETEIEE